MAESSSENTNHIGLNRLRNLRRLDPIFIILSRTQYGLYSYCVSTYAVAYRKLVIKPRVFELRSPFFCLLSNHMSVIHLTRLFRHNWKLLLLQKRLKLPFIFQKFRIAESRRTDRRRVCRHWISLLLEKYIMKKNRVSLRKYWSWIF